jgi:hypothetical protein
MNATAIGSAATADRQTELPCCMQFNPFQVPIGNIAANDILQLKGVAEGWFVEYKRELPPKAEAIAKTVGAFANHQGGWLFYGVEESPTAGEIPVAFPGIEDANIGLASARIRDAVTAHLSPPPHFDLQVVQGDGQLIPVGRSLVIVMVPAGPKPPYVHSSGSVFSRVGSKSEPIRDQATLEALFRRTQKTKGDLQTFFDRKPLTMGSYPFAQIFMLPDPYDVHGWRHQLTFQRFAELMRDKPESAPETIAAMAHMPLEHCQTLSGVFVATQPEAGVTWRFDRLGGHVISARLPVGEDLEPFELEQWLSGYQYADDYTDVWAEQASKPERIIDLTMWAGMLLAMAVHLERFRRECAFKNDDGKWHCMVKLHNVGVAAPFIDTKSFIDHIKSHGIPLTHDGDLSIPTADAEILATLKGSEDDDGTFGNALFLLLLISGALGVPWSEHLYHPEPSRLPRLPLQEIAGDWIQAIDRARDVQLRRSARWQHS